MTKLNANLGGSILQKNTFLASAGDGCGFMFSEDGNDTGIGSAGNGVLYFMINGDKHFLRDIALTYFYDGGTTVDLNGVKQTGFHRFYGTVPVINGPVGFNAAKDCTMLVSGDSYGFQIIVDPDSINIYYRCLNWEGTPVQWRRISSVAS